MRSNFFLLLDNGKRSEVDGVIKNIVGTWKIRVKKITCLKTQWIQLRITE